MSMPFPRVMIIPIGCVVRVTKSGSVFSIQTLTTINQINSTNHTKLKSIGSGILNYHDNDDIDDSHTTTTSDAPYIISAHSIGLRYHYTAYKLDATNPNAQVEQLAQGEFCQGLNLDCYYFMARKSDIRGPWSSRSWTQRHSGDKTSTKEKPTKKKSGKK